MLTVSFDYRGVVDYEFLPTDQTANKEYYLIRHFCEAIRKKRPELWADKSWILNLDNVTHVWLMAVPEAQETTAGKSFWVDWRDRTWNGTSIEGYTYRRLFSMLRRLEETLAQVHWGRGNNLIIFQAKNLYFSCFKNMFSCSTVSFRCCTSNNVFDCGDDIIDLESWKIGKT